ncbi:unnamed protein product [marine sediment metagenome]|uniref:Uncharacterized protein n=1 Tax=marine sediment metagenome TaxID=412755 RepID=X1RWQ7_9ZZZZ
MINFYVKIRMVKVIVKKNQEKSENLIEINVVSETQENRITSQGSVLIALVSKYEIENYYDFCF